MKKVLHYIVIILLTTFIAIESAQAAAMPQIVALADTNDVVKKERSSFFSSLRSFFPFRGNRSTINEKLLSNVKVFPNPISDQINLSYKLGKQENVSIKVMDALGNEVMTLLNQEMEAGVQSHSFETSGKLTNGFYFIRVSAGTETVVKRISVL